MHMICSKPRKLTCIVVRLLHRHWLMFVFYYMKKWKVIGTTCSSGMMKIPPFRTAVDFNMGKPFHKLPFTHFYVCMYETEAVCCFGCRQEFVIVRMSQETLSIAHAKPQISFHGVSNWLLSIWLRSCCKNKDRKKKSNETGMHLL